MISKGSGDRKGLVTVECFLSCAKSAVVLNKIVLCHTSIANEIALSHKDVIVDLFKVKRPFCL